MAAKVYTGSNADAAELSAFLTKYYPSGSHGGNQGRKSAMLDSLIISGRLKGAELRRAKALKRKQDSNSQ